jgi:dual specificity phosphatase 12
MMNTTLLPGPIVNTAQEIVPGLWLGGQGAARDLFWLLHQDIQHILDIGSENDRHHHGVVAPSNYTRIDLQDVPTAPIAAHFDHTYHTIDAALKKKEPILVHCMMGISRSPSIVANYLMRRFGYDADAALAFLKAKRRFVNPNPGFVQALRRN